MAWHGALYDGNLDPVGQDDRQLLDALLGSIYGAVVFTSSDLVCSAGSGSNTNISSGRAVVPNTFASVQGGSYLIRNDATTSYGHGSNSSGNPRVDLVAAKVYDSETGGDSSDITSGVILPGTATSGATLTNLTGAPGQSGGPSISLFNYIPLAYALVPTGFPGSGSLTYLDARPKFRGSSIISASQSTTSTTYTTLGTPDQVTGIVLPPNGLIRIWYQGTWQESVSGAARAAIFIGSNQLEIAMASNAAATQAAATGGINGSNLSLSTFVGGLCSQDTGSYAGDVTTGQIIGQFIANSSHHLEQEVGGSVTSTVGPGSWGGACEVFAAPGTYTVSVQFKASSGTATASNRKLWVRAIPFN